MAGEKTERATPKRRQEERKKGNIFQSREVVTVASLLITFYALQYLGPMILATLEKSIVDLIGQTSTLVTLHSSDLQKLYVDGCVIFLISAAPMLLICGAVNIIFTVAQTRGLFSMKAAAPKFSRISFLQGIKRLFSMRGVIELIKSLLKIIVLGWIIYNTFKKEIALMPRLIDMSFQQSIAFTGNMILDIAKNAAIIMAFVAMFDFLYQWWDYEKNMRMSKQEIKEEYKQTEGDPQIKGKIKERQNQMARRRMMQNVPKADVVIRNPTHFAVAIQYDPRRNNAPIVIAKGADRIALKIVAVAQEHQIVIMENKPLARGLYEAVEIDREIPDQFYQPVAEVLAFVYSLKKKDLK